jgi:hypothetical protein
MLVDYNRSSYGDLLWLIPASTGALSCALSWVAMGVGRGDEENALRSCTGGVGILWAIGVSLLMMGTPLTWVPRGAIVCTALLCFAR